MDYSSDLLTKIQDLSSHLTPPVEISALLDVDEKELLDDLNTPGHPARRAFMKGYSETALKLRKQNLDLVDAGSPAADEACRGYLKRMIRDIDL
jgi:hypothetical protein